MAELFVSIESIDSRHTFERRTMMKTIFSGARVQSHEATLFKSDNLNGSELMSESIS